eukprot:362077-Chlamydomonas_euryale.AAC.14
MVDPCNSTGQRHSSHSDDLSVHGGRQPLGVEACERQYMKRAVVVQGERGGAQGAGRDVRLGKAGPGVWQRRVL